MLHTIKELHVSYKDVHGEVNLLKYDRLLMLDYLTETIQMI